MYWNADGVRSKQTEIAYFMATNHIDVALINETHLTNNLKFKIPGYKIYRRDRPIAAGKIAAGGVAVAILQSIRHSEFPLPSFDAIEAVAVELTIGGKKTVLAALYSVPPSKIENSDLNKLVNIAPRFIAAGDLNSKHTHWNSRYCNRTGRLLLDHSSNKPYIICAPYQPTYYPYDIRNNPDVLDIAIIKNFSNNFELKVHDVMDSDHLPVTLELKTDVEPAEPRVTNDYRKADWRGLVNQLGNRLGAPPKLNSPQEIDHQVDIFTTAIQTAISDNIPLKTPVAQKLNLPSHIKNLITEKNRARKRWQRTGIYYHKTQLNQLQDLVKSKIKEFKNNQWDKKVEGLNSMDGSVWKMTKALIGNNIIIPPLQNNLGRMVYTPLEKANALAQVLEDAFTPNRDPINNQHNEIVQTSVQQALAKRTNCLPRYTDSAELREIVRTLKPKKAPGPDNIQNIVLRHVPTKALEHLANIINSSLNLGHFPNQWKEAKILAFPKPGKDKKNPKNYRPISLLNTMSKVFEKVLLTRIMKFINKYKLLPDEQFGFRKNHSTGHALLRLVEEVTHGFNHNRVTVAAFLDVEKAFDRVWHVGLVYKLTKMKIPDCYVRLISNYLSGRVFRVAINGTLSDSKEIRAGVPQGSIIGPILYTLYTKDLPRNDQTKFGCFADDTVIYSQSWSPNLAKTRVQNSLTVLQDWLTKWRIKINTTKSEAIEHRRGGKQVNDTHLTIFNEPIEWKESVKYLGVTLDRKLIWKAHIENQRKKAYGRLCQLYPILNRESKLSQKSGVTIFKALLRPVLLYAAPIWGTAAKSHLNHMQIFQNKVLRIILRADRYAPITDMHEVLEIEPIVKMIKIMAEQLYNTSKNAENPLVNALGRYDHTANMRYKRPKEVLNY